MKKINPPQKKADGSRDPAKDPSQKEKQKTSFSEIINRPEYGYLRESEILSFEKYKTPSEGYVEKFREKSGIVLAISFSAIFFVVLLGFFLGWLFTRPSLEDVKSLVAGDPSALLDYYKALGQNHLDTFTKAIGVILAPFVPIYSFILGYVFNELRIKRRRTEEG